MDKLGIKATFYDIFGYLLPGLISFSLIGIIYCQISNHGLKSLFAQLSNLPQMVTILLLIFSYAAGHAISSVSSYAIEKRLLPLFNKLPTIILFPKVKLIKSQSPFQSFSPAVSDMLDRKFKNMYNALFNEVDFRLCITHVETNQPVVYSTAFVFLSFYGMARNLALIFFIWGGIELAISIAHLARLASSFAGISVTLFLIFLYEYFRFYRYFIQEIIGGFLASEQK